MDYLETYNYFYNKTERILETFIKESLVKSRNEERDFVATINKINDYRIDYTNGFTSKKINNISYESCVIFNNRYNEYTGDNVNERILKKECFDAFNISIENNKIVYSYNKYVANLAINESIRRTGNRFRNYKNLYELMYDLNDFNDFSLKEVKGGFKSDGLYDRLFKRRYPDNVTQSDFKQEEIVEKKNKEPNDEPKLNRFDESVLNIINTYSVKDKTLLLYVIKYALGNSLNISAIELLRLLYICKVDDISLFRDNYKNNTSYKKMSIGHNYLSIMKKGKIEAIENLIIKNAKIGLKDINVILEDILENEVVLG